MEAEPKVEANKAKTSSHELDRPFRERSRFNVLSLHTSIFSLRKYAKAADAF